MQFNLTLYVFIELIYLYHRYRCYVKHEEDYGINTLL
jgi:hypothetical protein